MRQEDLFRCITEKADLKHSVYKQTFQAFRQMKQVIRDTWEHFGTYLSDQESAIIIKCKDRSEYEMEVQFGGDTLIFMMHSNVFQFPSIDEVNESEYIHKDSERSFVGVINIYNFLSDSFKYRRVNDLGYLIGRVFINKEGHYFIQGKKELSQLHNNFARDVITEEKIENIVLQAVLYTLNFELLTPPYKAVKVVSVNDFQSASSNLRMPTGKRLGFAFNETTFEEEHDNIE